MDSYSRDVTLAQGWTKPQETLFQTIPIGSPMVYYDIFLNLEQPDNNNSFLDDDYLLWLGLIPRERSIGNPDSLPVGINRDIVEGKAYAGTNCALCHTNVIEYSKPPRGNGRQKNKDYSILINGGSSMHRVDTFPDELYRTLERTFNDSDKFDRLATAILGNNPNQGEKNKLAKRLEENIATLTLYREGFVRSGEWGPGRMDAFGIIANFFTAIYNGEEGREANYYLADAPNSIPQLWGTAVADFIQWTGPIASFANLENPDVQAFAGNTATATLSHPAFFGTVDIPTNKNKLAYKNNTRLLAIRQIDNLFLRLKSPRWPERILPKIDRKMARSGRAVYRENCASCHQVIPRALQNLPYKVTMSTIEELGTDPAGLDFLLRSYVTDSYEGRLTQGILGDPIGPTAEVTEIASNAFVGMLIDRFEAGEVLEPFIFENFNPFLFGPKAQLPGYKGRPLNGIWSTPPFLHNGSVPNLYELLLPADERSTEFWVGSKRFDPVNVGFSTEINDDDIIQPYLYDTSIRGNYNTGHEFGVYEMSDEQRWDLIEYIKTL